LLLDVELLPDWYDDFVEVERERLRQLVLYVYEAVAGELGRRGDIARALDLAFRAVAAAPWRESTHRLVMRLHIADGNIAEAVRHYRQLERTLSSELGVRPSAMTTQLITEFLNGNPMRSPKSAASLIGTHRH
jgi:DNA-binding SARP family transcriptional activator